MQTESQYGPGQLLRRAVAQLLREREFRSRDAAAQAISAELHMPDGQHVSPWLAQVCLDTLSAEWCLPGAGATAAPARPPLAPAASPIELPACEYIRQAQLLRVLPFSGSTLNRMVRADEFPSPVRLAPRVKAWRVADVRAWLEMRGSATKRHREGGHA